MIDLSLSVRKEILAHFENTAAITSIVPIDRIYAMSVPAIPTWPFIRYGVPISNGFEATCWDGSTGTITIHAFTETTESMSGEDQAMMLSNAIIASMEDFKPSSFGIVDLQWSNATILQDSEEADKFHAVIEFLLTAVTLH